MPKKVGTLALLTDHRKELPGMMDKQNVVRPGYGIGFSHKKGRRIDTSYSVDQLGNAPLSEERQEPRVTCCMTSLM